MDPVTTWEGNPLRYAVIANSLRDQITTGALRPGERIPSETALIEQYQVSRMTVRQAIAELRSEGLVVSQHGRGVFVRDTPTPRPVSPDMLWAPDLDTAVLDVEAVGADPVERAALALRPNAKVVRARFWHRLPDGAPAAVTTVAVPRPIGQDARLRKNTITHPQDVLDRLAATGNPVASHADEVAARSPGRGEALLMLDPGIPVLTIARTGRTADGSPIALIQVVYTGDRHRLTLT